MASIDQQIDGLFRPVASALSEVAFFSVAVGGAELQIVVLWLICGAIFCTFYFRFINLRGFRQALRIVVGAEDRADGQPGEVSHFQALTTAVSGTVGVGNIAHVAVAVSLGGPGAAFWMFVAGFLGMSSKFVECTLGLKYRQQNADGSVSGGPMFYLDKGLAELGWPRAGRVLAHYYAICVLVGSLGIGCMFQANQAFVQAVNATGREASPLTGHGWAFGVALAVLVGLVIVGGIRWIARVTSRLVPLMVGLYLVTALVVIGAHYDRIPLALASIVTSAFTPQAATGGFFAVLIVGFRRAALSNEAGIGSAAIAHSAARTREPVTQGLVAMLEPFIDTMVICMITALVITVAYPDPIALATGQFSGVELTSDAFASVVPWFPYPLALVVFLFAYSTMISWSYYGLEGSIYLFGARRGVKLTFNALFCLFVVIGCATQLDAILEFSDAMVFAMALVNVGALLVFAPIVKRELQSYGQRHVGCIVWELEPRRTGASFVARRREHHGEEDSER